MLFRSRLGGYIDNRHVTVDGRPLADIQEGEIRRAIYAQEKEPSILSGTIQSFFAVPSSGRIGINEALSAASAEDILDSLEGDGFDAEIVERGRTLSGGQRQRLALARTLFVDPPVMVLDDPTSAVDAHTEARIAERIRKIRPIRTTVVFTNSPLLLDQCDRVVLISDGKVFAEGIHLQLLSSHANYRSLVVRGE